MVREDMEIRQDDLPDHYVEVNEACRLFDISRNTFYRMKRNPKLALEDGKVVLRIPPGTGRLKVHPRLLRERLARFGKRGRHHGGMT